MLGVEKVIVFNFIIEVLKVVVIVLEYWILMVKLILLLMFDMIRLNFCLKIFMFNLI